MSICLTFDVGYFLGLAFVNSALFERACVYNTYCIIKKQPRSAPPEEFAAAPSSSLLWDLAHGQNRSVGECLSKSFQRLEICVKTNCVLTVQLKGSR